MNDSARGDPASDDAAAPGSDVVAILIVAYNAAADLRDCLASLFAADDAGAKMHVVVVDNASTDETPHLAAEFPQATFVTSPKNVGFAAGNNLAWEQARRMQPKPTLVCLLNQDVVVESDWLAPLVQRFRQRPDVAAIQSKLLLYDAPDRINTAGNLRHFLGFGFMSGANEPDGDRFGDVAEIGYPSGAAVTIRADLLESWGLFVPEYFMYLEDADLGWNVRAAGLRNEMLPASRVLHKYTFRAGFSHYYWLERNRWLLLLTHYRLGTLLLLAPAALVMELGQLYFSLRIGRLTDKLRSWCWFWNPRNAAAVLRVRRRVFRLRVASDAELLEGMIAELPSIGGGPQPPGWLNRLLATYHRWLLGATRRLGW